MSSRIACEGGREKAQTKISRTIHIRFRGGTVLAGRERASQGGRDLDERSFVVKYNTGCLPALGKLAPTIQRAMELAGYYPSYLTTYSAGYAAMLLCN